MNHLQKSTCNNKRNKMRRKNTQPPCCWNNLKKDTFSEHLCNNDKKGLNPNIWGPPAWVFLHSIAANFPNPLPTNACTEDKLRYRERVKQHVLFMNSLQYVLPCGECRRNYRKNLRDLQWKNNTINQPALKNRKNFTRFMYDLHNKVNAETDKMRQYKIRRKRIPTLTEVRKMYNNFRVHSNREYLGQKGRTLLRVVPYYSDPTVTFTVSDKCIYTKK